MYKVFINNKEYSKYLVQGFTIDEEYNETLDSGSIILSQSPKLDIKPFDDVIISNGDISKAMKTQFKYYDCNITIEKTFGYNWIDKSRTYNNTYSTDVQTADVSSENKVLVGKAIENLKEKTMPTEQYFEEFAINVYYTDGTSEIMTYTLDTTISAFDFYSDDKKRKIRGTARNVDPKGIIFRFDDENNILGGKTLQSVGVSALLSISNKYYRAGEGWQYKLTLSGIDNFTSSSQMSVLTLACILNGEKIDYNFKYENGTNFTFKYGSLLTQKIIKFENNVAYFYGLKNFDFYSDVNFIHLNYKNKNNDEIVKPSFYKHFLIDTFTEERLNLVENLYKYKITLMSETKWLEKIQCPNLSITQPLNVNKRHTIWEKLNDFVNLYNMKVKIASETNDTFYVENKFSLDEKLENVFKNIIAPEFSLTNPNLREVLSQLFIAKDLIPVVKDNAITYLDLSKTNGAFDYKSDKVNYIERSLSSKDYAQNLKTQYNGALAQENSASIVEYLGFRNESKGLMTLNDLELSTRYPIYKINKIYLCYYKKYTLVSEQGATDSVERAFLCKQDITDLVLLNSLRNTLSTDWLDSSTSMPTSLVEAAKYKLYTIGYDINSNKITGWGTRYSYPIKNTWYDKSKTYIENILDLVDSLNPYGDKSYNYFKTNETDKNIVVMGSWRDSIVMPKEFNNNLTLAMKSLIFQVEYQPFYNGILIHSKDNQFGELVDNDGNSDGLVLLESDGNFKKEKINRLGNDLLQINALYNSPSELQEIGTTYDNDLVIYHRSYSVYDNCIKANYYATKDYIMKNYYTSVWAQKRPYNLIDYAQAVSRCENKKIFLMLDKNEMYNDGSNLDFNITNYENNVYYLLTSAFVENEHIESKNDFYLPDKINTALFYNKNNQYMSDANVFVSGTSLCLNARMFDNVSGGVAINKIAPDVGIIDANDNYTKGTTQEWLLMCDDRETGEIENIGVYFCHTSQSNIFLDEPKDYSESNYSNLFDNVIFKLPLNNSFDYENQKNLIGKSFEIKKDNKELLDFTYQIEPITKDKDIKFTSLFSKLSNLINLQYKNDTSYTITDTQVKIIYSINARYFTGFSATQPGTEIGIMRLLIKKDVISKMAKNDELNFNYIFGKGGDRNGQIILAINKCVINSISTSSIEIKLNVYYSYWTEEGVKIENTQDIEVSQYLTASGDYYTTGDIRFEDYMGASNNVYSPDYISRFVNKEGEPTTTTIEMNKNMFVLLGKNELSGKNEMINIENDYIKTNYSVSNLFKAENDNRNVPFIKIDLSKLSDSELTSAKTIEYWFLDGSYKFVFGVNLSEIDKANKYVKIYLSLLSNKNLNVYDSRFILKGKSSNFVDNQKIVNNFAKYDLI